MSTPRKSRTSRPSPRPSRMEAPAPEIKVSYAPAGRETLEAISDEILEEQPTTIFKRRRPLESTPEISVGESPVGRETLAAIEAELSHPQPSVPARREMPTKPGVATQVQPVKVKLRRGKSSRPPAVSRANAAAASSTLALETESPVATPNIRICELLTFVVEHGDSRNLASDEQRRRFVETHLIQRLPSRSMCGVERIDVTPWTERGMLVIRVWCSVA